MRNKIRVLALCAISLGATPSLNGQTSDLLIRYTDLHPERAVTSDGYGLGDEQAVGVADVGRAMIYGYEFPTFHAAIWSGNANSFVDLHPGGYTNLEFLGAEPPSPYPAEELHPGWPTWSLVQATAGNQQAGLVFYGSPLDAFEEVKHHAAIWSGTADSFVDIHPGGYLGSWAWATSGSKQAGVVYTDFLLQEPRAALWSGSAASFVDLHPAGASASAALGISGNQQAGWMYGGRLSTGTHAALWSGTADSFVDLHPSGATSSEAWSISGTQQAGEVGFGSLLGGMTVHAALWTGTANSFVDLNPAGARASSARATKGGLQVGYADFDDGRHAGIWFGTADSFVDLQAVLDSSFYLSSEARAVWTDGATIKIVGSAVWGGTALSHAVQWTITLPDTTPPVITRAWASRKTLWPPNHRMVAVQVSAVVVDDSGQATWQVIGVRSNEPDTGAPDMELVSATEVNLRASRSGHGAGRVYTILLQAQDAAGNLSQVKSVQVTVPHNAHGR